MKHDLPHARMAREAACAALNKYEGWTGKQPATVQHMATLTIEIEVSGEVDAADGAAIDWTPAMLEAIGEQLREQLGEHYHGNNNFDEDARAAGADHEYERRVGA